MCVSVLWKCSADEGVRVCVCVCGWVGGWVAVCVCEKRDRSPSRETRGPALDELALLFRLSVESTCGMPGAAVVLVPVPVLVLALVFVLVLFSVFFLLSPP